MYLLNEFARRKIYDYVNEANSRTDITKIKQRVKEVREGYANLKNLSHLEKSRLAHKKELNKIEIRSMRLNQKALSPKIDKLKEPIGNRLSAYKFNKEKQKEYDEVKNWLKNRKKTATNTAGALTITKKSPVPTKSLLGKKLAIGAGAIVTTGLGIAAVNRLRKSRSDKGKKRK